jgi:NTE family protein
VGHGYHHAILVWVHINRYYKCRQAKGNKNNNSIRYFWDGGVLSNTPLRELLEAHQEYWSYVENKDKIPDLDIYIVNVHPSKIETDMIPKDYDGVKDRHNDIKYGDRTSRYDENIAHLISDYTNFCDPNQTSCRGRNSGS